MLSSKNYLRVIVIGLGFALGYLVLAIKLWIVQIEHGSIHRQKISRQSIRRIRIPGQRGKIITSDGHLLATNRPLYNGCLFFEEMRQSNRKKTIAHIKNTLSKIYEKLERKPEVDDKTLSWHLYRPGTPLKIVSDLTMEEMAKFIELMQQNSGLSIMTDNKRIYPAKDIAAHIVGYTRPEDPGAAKDKTDFSYYVPDPKGVRGLERVFDKFPYNSKLRGLKGSPGFKLVQVDNMGFVRKIIIDEVKPMPGNNLVLTINWQAQKIATDLMRGKQGAFVLLNADSGEVLALCSSPSFDLNSFIPSISHHDYQALLKNPNMPLLDRALYGQYMPGSIVKPIVCLSFLEDGINPDSSIECDGFTKIGNAKIRCVAWRRGGHGVVNMYETLQRSCNDYMIEKALETGFDKIQNVFKRAGIGSKTGIELPERSGLLPSRQFCQKIRKRQWRNHDTGLVSIGQGMVEVTPIQAAVFTAAIANGGKIMRPFLLKEVRDTQGNLLFTQTPQVKQRLTNSTKNLKILDHGMYLVVNSDKGGGRRAQNKFIELKGKTGTAEVGYGKNRHKNVWFVCYGKYQGKNYAAAVLVERNTFGSLICAPIMKNFFSQWLPTQKSRNLSEKVI